MTQGLAVDNQEQARVLTMAVVQAADKLELSGKDLARILGVSEPTMSRMRKNKFRLEAGSKSFELGALFVRLFRSLDAITGGDHKVANAWLRNENKTLGGRPLDQIKTISGLTLGLAYLDSRPALL
ncbi:MAG: MbcA/ParS/Xre antitoxin family protein [Paracoccaceae bacterium]|nr:MbcA/ParS/Xre antitoxin family protein [Paracoccaceae bacterium]MDE2675993.1 MbcA/ParS/Xre antitoxin family protein [Paracoccaceae bacterium]